MEGYDASTYGERIADLYDAWYGERLDPTAAVELLVELARGGRALELGVGTGRVAIPLVERGVTVVGIDASEAMVSQLRSKPGGDQVEVVMGDFADVPVSGRFALVYVPFTTFFAIDSQERQIECMRNVAEHLEDGGHFVVEAFVPDLSRFGTTNQATTTAGIGLDHVIIDAMRHDPITQIVEGHHVLIGDSSVRLSPMRLRYCWPSELDAMAQVVSMRLVARYGDYDRRPFEAGSGRHVSVYQLTQ